MHEPKPREESVSTEIYLESRNQKILGINNVWSHKLSGFEK